MLCEVGAAGAATVAACRGGRPKSAGAQRPGGKVDVRRNQNRQGRGSIASRCLLVCCIGVAGCATVKSVSSDFASVAEDVAAHARLAPAPLETLRLEPPSSTTTKVLTRSYRVGESYTSRVGEPMLSVKNYSLRHQVVHASALRDFQQVCDRLLSEKPGACADAPLSSVHGSLGTVFDVQGMITTPDGDYFAVSLPVPDGKDVVYLLVDENGHLRAGGYVAWHRNDSRGHSVSGLPLAEVVPPFPIDEESPLFKLDSEETFTGSGSGYLNYDLVYAGSRATDRGDSVFLSYREYGRQKTDHLVFEQNLQYSITDRDIQVAGLRLHVDTANPESITFSVVEDDSEHGAVQQ